MKVQDNVDSGRMDPTTIPPEYLTTSLVLTDIDISVNDHTQPTEQPESGKAASPDNLRLLLLKELRVELAPIIKVVLKKKTKKKP